MKWFVLFFSDDTENEYFKGTEQEAKNAFADKKVIEIWECNNDYLVQNRSTYICNRRIPKVAKKKCRCLQQCRKTNAS